MSFEEKDVNELVDNQDIIAAEMQALGRKFPWMVEALVAERDQFMVLELEQTVDELENGDVVAVVGAAHVPGMTRLWNQRQQLRLINAGTDKDASAHSAATAENSDAGRDERSKGTTSTDAYGSADTGGTGGTGDVAAVSNFQEESEQLHQRLQYFPGMQFADGSTYTKKELREYAKRFSKSSS